MIYGQSGVKKILRIVLFGMLQQHIKLINFIGIDMVMSSYEPTWLNQTCLLYH